MFSFMPHIILYFVSFNELSQFKAKNYGMRGSDIQSVSDESHWTQKRSHLTKVSLPHLRLVSLDSEEASLDSGESQWTQVSNSGLRRGLSGLMSASLDSDWSHWTQVSLTDLR